MKILIKNTEGLILPTKAHSNDSCFDITATSDPIIVGDITEDGSFWKRIDYIEYKTDLYIQPLPEQKWDNGKCKTKFYDTLIYPRSSITKYNLLLKNSVGVVDQGYINEWFIRFSYIFQPEDLYINSFEICGSVNLDKIYKKGNRVAQFRPSRVFECSLDVVDKLGDTERGMSGWGSSGS